jgi:hypothetical protein
MSPQNWAVLPRKRSVRPSVKAVVPAMTARLAGLEFAQTPAISVSA